MGLPNAGKSTFLSVVSNAKPKIADYPFTTLEPRLGTLLIDDRALVVADIPGLIEGASEGKGLGDRFLGHIERCAVLIHLVDGTGEDPVAAWHTIRAELLSYGHGLAEKDEIVCLNKCDALDLRPVWPSCRPRSRPRPAARPRHLGRRPYRHRARAARGGSARPGGPACPRGRGPGPPGVSAPLEASRLTVEVGSALPVDESGEIRTSRLDTPAADLLSRRRRGQEVIVATSGAIALGRPLPRLPRRQLRLEEKQAAAAAGRIILAHAITGVARTAIGPVVREAAAAPPRGPCPRGRGPPGVSASLEARRLTVKVGSALLVDESGEIRTGWLDSLAADLLARRRRGQEVIVVTSGAIARRPLRLEEKKTAPRRGRSSRPKPSRASPATRLRRGTTSSASTSATPSMLAT